MSSTGRPLMPPDLLMRSMAIWVPTRAVLPPAAAAPESGCSVPILYGLPWPKAARHGVGTSIVAPSAPALAALHPTSRRRVTLPLYQNSSSRSCASSLSSIAFPLWTAQTDFQIIAMSGTGEDLDYACGLGLRTSHTSSRRMPSRQPLTALLRSPRRYCGSSRLPSGSFLPELFDIIDLQGARANSSSCSAAEQSAPPPTGGQLRANFGNRDRKQRSRSARYITRQTIHVNGGSGGSERESCTRSLRVCHHGQAYDRPQAWPFPPSNLRVGNTHRKFRAAREQSLQRRFWWYTGAHALLLQDSNWRRQGTAQ